MDISNEILCILSVSLRRANGWRKVDFNRLTEIRIRAGKPLLLWSGDSEYYFDENEGLAIDKNRARIVDACEIKEIMDYTTNYSLYAYEEELKQGFITIKGGHRIGICGRVVMEKGELVILRNISSINIRVAHQVKDCGMKIVHYLFSNSSKSPNITNRQDINISQSTNISLDTNIFQNTLIFSPPGTGKTTLLRDLVRILSDGFEKVQGMSVGIVDERCEIAAGYLGEFQNDVGMRTDVIECCSKYMGMMMLLRSMAPKVIAVDELGGAEDIDAICHLMHCGIGLVATMHADSIDDIEGVLREKVFKRFIALQSSNEQISATVYDSCGTVLWRGKI